MFPILWTEFPLNVSLDNHAHSHEDEEDDHEDEHQGEEGTTEGLENPGQHDGVTDKQVEEEDHHDDDAGNEGEEDNHEDEKDENASSADGDNHCVQCPIPCKSTMYEPSVSYASLSNFDTDNLLQNTETSSLTSNYIKAREAAEKVIDDKLKKNRRLIEALAGTVETLSVVFSTIIEKSVETMKKLQRIADVEEARFLFHYGLSLTEVEYIMKHDFVRGYEIRQERYFDYVCANFYGVEIDVEHYLDRAEDAYQDGDNTTRRALWYAIESSLINREWLAKTSKAMLADVNESYITGNPLLTYKATIDRRYDMSFIAVELLTTRSEDQQEYITEANVGFDTLIESLLTLLRVGKNYYTNFGLNSTDQEACEEAFAGVVSGCKAINYRLFLIEDRIINTPVTLIQERMQMFQNYNNSLYEAKRSLQSIMEDIQNTVNDITVLHWPEITKVVDESLLYLAGSGNVTKTSLAYKITQEEMTDTVQSIDTLFKNLRSRDRELTDTIKLVHYYFQGMWALMAEESSTKQFYEMLYNDFQSYLSTEDNEEEFLRIFASLLDTTRNDIRGQYPNEDIARLINADLHGMNISAKLAEIDEAFTSIELDSNIMSLMNELDVVLMDNFDDLKDEMGSFLRGNVINADFIL